jgi:hypothetical protein
MNNLIAPSLLATNVLKAYEFQYDTITNVEFFITENGRTKHRATINGNITVDLYMHYEVMTAAHFKITINVYNNTWTLKTNGYLDEVNVEYTNETIKDTYDYLDLKEWINNFVDTVYQAKCVEKHGFVIVP